MCEMCHPSKMGDTSFCLLKRVDARMECNNAPEAICKQIALKYSALFLYFGIQYTV